MKPFQADKRHFLFALVSTALLASTSVQAQTALDDVLKSKVLKVETVPGEHCLRVLFNYMNICRRSAQTRRFESNTV